jgi:hypothetical protein
MRDEIQNILYQISIFPDSKTTEDKDNKVIIAKTLSKLPKDVIEKVLDEVLFIQFGNDYGRETCVYFYPVGKCEKIAVPVIMLNFGLMVDKKDSEKMDNVRSKIIEPKKQLERKMKNLNIDKGFVFTNLKELKKIEKINEEIRKSNIESVSEDNIFKKLDEIIQNSH